MKCFRLFVFEAVYVAWGLLLASLASVSSQPILTTSEVINPQIGWNPNLILAPEPYARLEPNLLSYSQVDNAAAPYDQLYVYPTNIVQNDQLSNVRLELPKKDQPQSCIDSTSQQRSSEDDSEYSSAPYPSFTSQDDLQFQRKIESLVQEVLKERNDKLKTNNTSADIKNATDPIYPSGPNEAVNPYVNYGYYPGPMLPLQAIQPGYFDPGFYNGYPSNYLAPPPKPLEQGAQSEFPPSPYYSQEQRAPFYWRPVYPAADPLSSSIQMWSIADKPLTSYNDSKVLTPTGMENSQPSPPAVNEIPVETNLTKYTVDPIADEKKINQHLYYPSVGGIRNSSRKPNRNIPVMNGRSTREYAYVPVVPGHQHKAHLVPVHQKKVQVPITYQRKRSSSPNGMRSNEQSGPQLYKVSYNLQKTYEPITSYQ